MNRVPLAAIAACVWLTAPGGARAARTVELESRPGVRLNYVFMRDDGVEYPAVVVLFPGQGGDIGIKPEAVISKPNNFLVRSRRLFVDDGIAVAVVDSPADMKGMTNLFRKSRQHLADISAIIDDLHRRLPKAKMYLVGTSQGTVSAAYAGSQLGPKLGGVVLTSSVLGDGGRFGAGLNGFDFSSIRVPLLFVHHENDGCGQSPYYKAAGLAKRFPLITVHGGDSPKSDACEALSAHGYLGKEKETVDAIAAWILGRPYPKEIR